MTNILAIRVTGKFSGKPTIVFLHAVDIIVPDGTGSHIAFRCDTGIDVEESFDDILRMLPEGTVG